MTRWIAIACTAAMLLAVVPASAQESDDLPIVPLEPVKKKKKRKKRRRRRKKPAKIAPATPEPAAPAPAEAEPDDADLDLELELTPPPPESAPGASSPEPIESAPPIAPERASDGAVDERPKPPAIPRTTPPPRTDSTLLYGAYAALGASAIAAGIGTYYGVQAGEFDGLDRGPTGTSQQEAAQIRDDSESAAGIATGAWIAAGGLAATGAGLLLFHYLSGDDEPMLELSPDPGGLTLWLRGRF